MESHSCLEWFNVILLGAFNIILGAFIIILSFSNIILGASNIICGAIYDIIRGAFHYYAWYIILEYIILKAPSVMLIAPNIMMKVPSIMIKAPSIMLEALSIITLNHLSQRWLSIVIEFLHLLSSLLTAKAAQKYHKY